MSYDYDSAGNKIERAFLYPCPARCGLTGGCGECNIWTRNHAKTLIEKRRENELTQGEEERFYKKAFETKLLST